MSLCLQVRTRILEHGGGECDPYIYGDGEHKWFAVHWNHNNAVVVIDEIRGLSRKFPRDTASTSDWSDSTTLIVCGGEDIRKRKTRDKITAPGKDPKFPDPIEPMDPISFDFWYTKDTTTTTACYNCCSDHDHDVDVNDDGLDYTITSGGGGWIKGPSMLQPRSRACAVNVDDEGIFVFGGVRWPTRSTWAEVLYPGRTDWSPLHPPSISNSLYVSKCLLLAFESDTDTSDLALLSDSEISDFKFYLDSDRYHYYWDSDLDRMSFISKLEKKMKNRLILVYTPFPLSIVTGYLWSYDVCNRTWEMFDFVFGSWADELVLSSIYGTPTTTTTNSMDRFLLLTISKGLLRVYHLGQRKWLEEPLSGLEGNNVLPPPNLMNQIRLVSLDISNEKLCVLWSKYSNDLKALRVYFTKFTVFEDGSCLLAAKVESTNVFDFENGDALISCLPIAPRQLKKRGGHPHMEEDQGEEMKKIKHQHP